MSKLKQIKVRREMSTLRSAGAYNSQPYLISTNQYFPSSTICTSSEQITSSLSTLHRNTSDQLPQFPSKPLITEESTLIKQFANGKRTPEEQENVALTTDRLYTYTIEDHSMVTNPDMDNPFADENDVVKRLLPYHVFQQPKQDLHVFISGKGKEKAHETGLKEEIRATKTALQLVKRREAIRDRWRKLKINSARRSSSDDQAYYLAQVVLESDRSENVWIGNELRATRTEAERVEREKRASTNTSRTSHFSAMPQTPMPAIQTQYYRPYPYAYTQAYGSPIPAPTMSTFTVAPPPPTAPYTPYQPSSAIPVQLPVASLPALHALGIIPVPALSLPPEGQPQPPAVLRGSTANGTILSLEINVSLLQSAQMSGLATVLNSLVSRSNVAGPSNVSTPVPAATNAKGVDSTKS